MVDAAQAQLETQTTYTQSNRKRILEILYGVEKSRKDLYYTKFKILCILSLSYSLFHHPWGHRIFKDANNINRCNIII